MSTLRSGLLPPDSGLRGTFLYLILDPALCKESFFKGMGCGELPPFSWKDDQVWN